MSQNKGEQVVRGQLRRLRLLSTISEERMASAEYKKWRERFDSTGRIDPLELGQTRKEIENILGAPDGTSVPPRNKRLPQIFKYEEMEFHFENGIEGGLRLIFEHSKDGYVSTSIKKLK